jgi:lysophospholipase L1-like esterase
MMLALLALAAAPCLASLCGGALLAGVPLSLAAMPADRPVHIVQIGDSHTAGDSITGALRDALQARLGNGGRGLMPAGRPHPGVRTRGVTVSMVGKWQSRGLFGSGAAEPWPPRGITGYTLFSRSTGAALALTADASQSFSAFGVCVAASTEGPQLAITVGGRTETVDFTSDSDTPRCQRFPADRQASTARLELLAGEAIITGWWLERPRGLILSNLGVPGSQLQFLGRADTATMAAQFQALPPDLVVLAFGTNEGFAPNADAARLESSLREQVARLRALVGPVPILLLGPPDAASRTTALIGNAAGRVVDCNPAIESSPERLPVTGFDIPIWNDGDGVLASDPVAFAGPNLRAVRRGLPLFTPPGLDVVGAVQRRVAADLGLAFWDWRARQGGACAAVRWTQQRLMGPDFIHYSPAGGAEVARMLLDDLDAAQAVGKASPGANTAAQLGARR